MDQKTGSEDPEGKNQATLQPVDVLEKIKQTDGHAKRNVLAKRDECINNMKGEKVSIKSPGPPMKPSRTKVQLFEQQSQSIMKISESLEATKESKKMLLEIKTARAQVENLKEALALGLISEEEFKSRASKLLLK